MLFLLLSKDAQDGLELLSTVPSGFDFTYCQEWGLTINDAVVARVVLDLRRKSLWYLGISARKNTWRWYW